MIAALDRPGIWKRAGMAGFIAGLDMAEAMQSVPAECDDDLCRRLFVIAETSYVAKYLAARNAEAKNDD